MLNLSRRVAGCTIMKIIIFAGGVGSRFWPISRRKFPKQFQKIFNGKSTLELAWQRTAPYFGAENIYLQITPELKNLALKELPELKKDHIIIEPERRNNGPAVCLALQKLVQENKSGPVAILWADHIMDQQQEFVKNLKTAEKLIQKNPNRFIFLAEQPRFANNNLGWIYVGEKVGQIGQCDYFKFLGWQYKPKPDECHKMFESGEYFWNTGYFISSIKFLNDQFQKLAPEMCKSVKNDYANTPKISFDQAIIERIDLSNAVILKTNLGWSDPGTLYGFKEVLQKNSDQNVTQGMVFNLNSKDCLVYNFEDKKLLTTVGLNGHVVVNTKDAIIVVPKDKVKQITELLEKLEQAGLEEYL